MMHTCHWLMLLCAVGQTQYALSQGVDSGSRNGGSQNKVLRDNTLVAVDQESALTALDSAMSGFLGSKEIAGAVIFVADKQGVMAQRAFGLADILRGKPMASDS